MSGSRHPKPIHILPSVPDKGSVGFGPVLDDNIHYLGVSLHIHIHLFPPHDPPAAPIPGPRLRPNRRARSPSGCLPLVPGVVAPERSEGARSTEGGKEVLATEGTEDTEGEGEPSLRIYGELCGEPFAVLWSSATYRSRSCARTAALFSTLMPRFLMSTVSSVIASKKAPMLAATGNYTGRPSENRPP